MSALDAVTLSLVRQTKEVKYDMSKTSRVYFSAEQVQYLQKTFSEYCGTGQSYAELQYRAGQRSVVEHIQRIANVEVRHVQRETAPVAR